MSEKLKIDRVIIVEGKYDKIKLSSILDATIITTNGFAIFKDKEKRAMIRALGMKRGIIIATDSDGAGAVIRGHLRGLLPSDKIETVYTPAVQGKEKRKTAPSAQGVLGVEGTDTEILRKLFAPYISGKERENLMELTRAEFVSLGYSGGENSSQKRKMFCGFAGLPEEISTKSLIEALNILYTKEEFEELHERVNDALQENTLC